MVSSANKGPKPLSRNWILYQDTVCVNEYSVLTSLILCRIQAFPRNGDLYGEFFERVFLKMYGRLKSIYNEIRDITGYPAL